jgi:hypothetical protein
MLWCALLGCISDIGGLMGDDWPGVLGTRAGEETMASMLGVAAASRAFSSPSVSDERAGVALGA